MSTTALTQVGNVFFKREDQNPTGSVKDRAIPGQIDYLISSGFKSAVISSTGNAAISTQYYCQQKNIPLTIFVSPHAHPQKLKLLKNVQKSYQPISDAIKFSKINHAYLLRQSTDPVAIKGYQSLGQEITKQLPRITSVYLPVGSGATLLGVAQILPANVKIFAVQPASNPSLAKFWRQPYTPEKQTITDALSVKTLPLKDRLIDTINRHHGLGVIVQNQEVITAQNDLKSLSVCPESALAYAGFIKTKKLAGAYPVIIVTGVKR